MTGNHEVPGAERGTQTVLGCPFANVRSTVGQRCLISESEGDTQWQCGRMNMKDRKRPGVKWRWNV